MQAVDVAIRRAGMFLRRRDLLARGYRDADIGRALAAHRIFRVRQGWYSVPDAPEPAIRAVRVGGRLTAISALESYGIPVPRSAVLHVAVPPTASRLRAPDDRRRRLGSGGAIVRWSDDRRGPDRWRVPVAAALAAVLVSQPRDIAVACFSLALNRRAVSWATVARIFGSAPVRVQRWRALLSDRDEAHGETYFRLWTVDAGIPCEQQVEVAGVGRLDFRVAAHTYVEVDGGQHDPLWTGGTASSWSDDLDRAAALAIRGDRVLHFGYRQLYGSWATVLAAVERAVADDAALTARRRRHPFRPVVRRKRRRSAGKAPP